jgi:hypothetical protein
MIDGPSLFTPWQSFYVIVGSSGAALTGLQFVVMALIAEADRKGSSEAVSAFGTPTVVHFCMVLAASAVLSAPWRGTLRPASTRYRRRQRPRVRGDRDRQGRAPNGV